MRKITILLFLLLSGCATTNITGFTDPSFKNKKYTSYVVVTPNLNLEYSLLLQKKICSEIEKYKSACTKGLDLFPPTRDLSSEQKAKVIKEKNIQGYLLVFYNGGNSETQQIASLAYGTANVYGNTVNSYGMFTPVYSFNRRDGYSLILIDTNTFKKAWVGGANIYASGLANITDEVFTTSLSEKISYSLSGSGHL